MRRLFALLLLAVLVVGCGEKKEDPTKAEGFIQAPCSDGGPKGCASMETQKTRTADRALRLERVVTGIRHKG